MELHAVEARAGNMSMPVPVYVPDMNDVIEVPADDRRADAIEAPAEERREDVRIIASIPGRYMLANRRDQTGDRCQFACRIVNVSLHAMELAAPVPGRVGERVIVYTEPFGRLHGAIMRLITDGFVMSISATPESRERLGTKLAWLAKQKDTPDLPDGRRNARVVPHNPTATIVTADGSTASCLVIDFSDTGAAVSADIYPEIGMPLAVGRMIGRVVRRFPEGFAVEFSERENLADIERKIASAGPGWVPSRKTLRQQ
jgi:hypothetical protein